MTIVLCSKGYPGKYKKGKIIKNINKLKNEKNSFVFHAGTKSLMSSSGDSLQLLTNGGRVLTVMASDPSIDGARKKVYNGVKHVKFLGAHYRTDIGIINSDE